jgi:hypothetical protein
MKKETVIRLLEIAKQSTSETEQDTIVNSILSEIGDNVLYSNKSALWGYVLDGVSIVDTLRVVENVLKKCRLEALK